MLAVLLKPGMRQYSRYEHLHYLVFDVDILLVLSFFFIIKDFPSLHCYAFAPPLVMDRELAESSNSFITSIVFQYVLIMVMIVNTYTSIEQTIFKQE